MPKWLLYALLAVLFWGGWGFVSRKLGDSVPAAQCQVISTLGLLPIMAVLGFSKNSSARGRKVRGSVLAFVAGLVGGVGNVMFYQLMSAGEKAATVVPLTSLYPLVTVMLAMVFLKEKLNPVQVAGIALALVAIYLFNVSQTQGVFASWLAFASLPIALWGVAGLLQKMCTNDLSSERSTLWFLAGFVAVSLVLLAFQPMQWSLPMSVWSWSILLGLLLGLGNLALLAAFANDGKASVITPLSGLYPVVTVPLAIVMLGEKVGAREMAGIILSLASVVALAYKRKAKTSVKPAG